MVGFEPLPAVISPDTIVAFLDFQRYFGVWPGLLGIVAGVGFLVLGLLVLMGFGEKPLQVNEVVEPPLPPLKRLQLFVDSQRPWPQTAAGIP